MEGISTHTKKSEEGNRAFTKFTHSSNKSLAIHTLFKPAHEFLLQPPRVVAYPLVRQSTKYSVATYTLLCLAVAITNNF